MSSKFIHGLTFPRNGRASPHRGRAQSRPSASEPEVAWTGGRGAISPQRREWQAAFVPASALYVLASSPRFHSHFFGSLHRLRASWGPQIRWVLQSNGRPGYRAVFGAVPVRALRAVTQTRRAFPKLNLNFMPRLRRGLCGHARVRILPLVTHSLCSSTASFRATATTARFFAFLPPRVASAKPHRRRSLSGPNGTKNVMRALDQQLSHVRISFLGNP